LLKKLTAALLSVLLLITVIPYKAQAVKLVYGDFFYAVYEGVAMITGYSGKGGEVTVPSMISNYPVTVIADEAFYAQEKITKIVLREGIKTVGIKAFALCTGLREINLPQSVTAVKSFAFAGCVGLSDIRIPENVKYLSVYSFIPNPGLKRIDVDSKNPDFTSENGVLMNKDKTELIFCPPRTGKFTVPATVRKIDDRAFYGSLDLSVVHAEKEALRGDANGDNCIDAADASLILTAYAEIQTGLRKNPDGGELIRYDFNEDGVISAVDASELLMYYAEIQTAIPDSGTELKVDSTPFKPIALSASLKKGMTADEISKATAIAQKVADKYAASSDTERIKGAVNEVYKIYSEKCQFTMETTHYSDFYGFYVMNICSSAGTARALGLLLNLMGVNFEHVNENKYAHQWCRVKIDGVYWVADGLTGAFHPEPAAYSW